MKFFLLLSLAVVAINNVNGRLIHLPPLVRWDEITSSAVMQMKSAANPEICSTVSISMNTDLLMNCKGHNGSIVPSMRNRNRPPRSNKPAKLWIYT